MILNQKDLRSDAWGRDKVVNDYSIVSGLFTFDVPNEIWKSSHNSIYYVSNADNPYVSSVDGELRLSCGSTIGDTSYLASIRHPRYQPNRGFLYSSSIIIPEPTIGQVDFGVFTVENGAFFRVREGKLYCVIFCQGTETEYEADVPSGIDLSSGNIYDIQFQWRGVGNYYFFVNQQCVRIIPYLGVTKKLTIANPALPIAFRVKNLDGTVPTIISGCADVTSEGGHQQKQVYKSVVSNEFSASNEVVMAVRIPEFYKGMYNTRDVAPQRVKTVVSKKSNINIYITRDDTALTGGVWEPINGGNIEVNRPVASGLLTFDSSKTTLLDTIPSEVGVANIQDNPNNERIDFFITNGCYMIFEVEGSAVATQVVLQLGEEV